MSLLRPLGVLHKSFWSLYETSGSRERERDVVWVTAVESKNKLASTGLCKWTVMTSARDVSWNIMYHLQKKTTTGMHIMSPSICSGQANLDWNLSDTD